MPYPTEMLEAMGGYDVETGGGIWDPLKLVRVGVRVGVGVGLGLGVRKPLLNPSPRPALALTQALTLAQP